MEREDSAMREIIICTNRMENIGPPFSCVELVTSSNNDPIRFHPKFESFNME